LPAPPTTTRPACGNHNSRHDGVVEHIGIQVYPEADDLRIGQVPDGVEGCVACAAFANLGEINNPDRCVFDTLTAVRLGILGVAALERHHVLVPDQRASALKIGYDIGPAAGGERKIHRCRLTVWLSLGLVEVGVAIEEQQPVTAAAPKGEQATEQSPPRTTGNSPTSSARPTASAIAAE
jgi:hypothetical protein